MKYLTFKSTLAACTMVLALFVSCEKNDAGPDDNGNTIEYDFHIAFANGSESISGTLVQGVEDLTQGTISPNVGWELESSRTARIFASKDGSTIYSLNYTVGTIEKLTYHGGDNYSKVNTIDTSIPLGAKAVRFTKINEDIASVHYISATAQYENPADTKSKYLGHKMVASIGILDLKTMQLKSGYNNNIIVDMGEELAAQGYNITRIDCPVLSGGKLYYGAAVSKFNPETGKNTATDKTFTLIIDYNDLSKTSVIYTDKVKGATNGYRTPTQHVNEAGEILQMVSGVNPDTKKNEVHIVKIKNGQYDEMFDYNLSTKLGKESSSNGWFYAGNGIGYIPYEDLTADKIQMGVNPSGEPTYSAMWKFARMDFNKGTVVDLNVPDDLWLTQYQNAPVRNGKLYIALSPVGKDGHVYIFDVKSESKDGTKGASITGTGADQYFIGIY
ncbi:hypothetical protein [Proteiniphilum sp.]|uniref:hypothetical protein n=1 Tax=Proteiniphilum sp. TaxID=1926877 RepID=UPI002B1F4502|nr:hypothetical protein [Proteiniphilum sp.]MEA4916853.1 hypothetical protein [Proteiniphilum sp.]